MCVSWKITMENIIVSLKLKTQILRDLMNRCKMENNKIKIKMIQNSHYTNQSYPTNVYTWGLQINKCLTDSRIHKPFIKSMKCSQTIKLIEAAHKIQTYTSISAQQWTMLASISQYIKMNKNLQLSLFSLLTHSCRHYFISDPYSTDIHTSSISVILDRWKLLLEY